MMFRNKNLKKALKETNSIVWYVTYTVSGWEDHTMTLYADNAKQALKLADKRLKDMYRGYYIIKSLSAI